MEQYNYHITVEWPGKWRFLHLVILAVMWLIIGVLAHWAWVEVTAPDCPTEDSCIVNYDRDGWEIIEIVP